MFCHNYFLKYIYTIVVKITNDQTGFDQKEYDQTGYDQTEYDQTGYDQKGYDQKVYDQTGFDEKGVLLDRCLSLSYYIRFCNITLYNSHQNQNQHYIYSYILYIFTHIYLLFFS